MFTREHLIFKALSALHEAYGACAAAPVPRTFALRFALAYLYAVAEGGDRAPFDAFWDAVTRPLGGANAAAAGIDRHQGADGPLTRIHRRLGVAETRDFDRIYWDARVATGSARRNDA
jgi:hypothetical protein